MNNKVVTACLVSVLLFSCFAMFNVSPVEAQGVTWSYNAGTNTATASGAGSTNFAALVAADTAGGWGKFTADATGTQIVCNGKIVIGDGTNACVFSDTTKQVIFTSLALPTDYLWAITVMAYSTLTLGQLDNLDNKTTSKGCQIYSSTTKFSRLITENTAGSRVNVTVNLYSCSFNSLADTSIATNGRIWNCIIANAVRVNTLGASASLFNIISEGKATTTAEHLQPENNPLLIENFRANGQGVGLYMYSSRNAVVKNFYGTNLSYGIRFNVFSGALYLVNAYLSSWSFVYTGSSTGVVYRQYEFDLTVLNGEVTEFVDEANVTLSKGEAVIGSWLTNSSGQIPLQTLTYGYYAQATGDTLQGGADPFLLTVTHPDWANYTSRFYVTEKTKMIISLQNETVVPTPDYSGYVTEGESEELMVVGGVVAAVVIGVVCLAFFVMRKND